MINRWTVQTERGDYTVNAVWATVEENTVAGKKSTAVVLNTGSKAAVVVLTTGMFYLKGPNMREPVLFRVQSSTRARAKDCMLVRAVEVADTVRLQENKILHKMRELLELDMMEAGSAASNGSFLGTVAS